MKYLFFAWIILLTAISAGCTATDLPPTQGNPINVHPVAPDNRVGLEKIHCPKPVQPQKSPWLRKINANLLCAATTAESRGAAFADIAARMGMMTVKTGVMLDIVTNPLAANADVKRKLHLPGVSVQLISAKYHRASLSIHDSTLLYQLAKMPEVRTIMPEYGGRTRGNNVGTGTLVEPKSYKLIHQ